MLGISQGKFADKPFITLLVEETQSQSLQNNSQVRTRNRTNRVQRKKNTRDQYTNTDKFFGSFALTVDWSQNSCILSFLDPFASLLKTNR